MKIVIPDSEKLKNFPSVNFISIPKSQTRRKILYENLEKYKIRTIRPYIYEVYKEGDHEIIFPDPVEHPEYKWTFPIGVIGSFTSHLKAIRDWYENTNEPYAFFCEDDISFETVQYWNFTWEEFFNNLPKDWECIQLTLLRENPKMFLFFDPEVHFRHRCWCDFGVAHLITRSRAKKLIDIYHKDESFIWEYRGSDKEIRKTHYQPWPWEPGIETILYSILDDSPVYTFPLFVANIELETTVWGDKVDEYDIQKYSYSSIIEWWKTRGKLLTVSDIFNYV